MMMKMITQGKRKVGEEYREGREEKGKRKA